MATQMNSAPTAGVSWFDANQPPPSATGGVPVTGVTPATSQGWQTPPTSTASTGAPPAGNPNDPAYVQSWLQWQANQPGADPILKTPDGIAYYQRQILANGGLTDTNYWGKKSTLASAGGSVGAAGTIGSLGQYQGGPFSMPTGVDEQNDPGYQFRLQQGAKAVETSAFAKGVGLSGGELKSLTGYGQGLASNEYQNVFNRAYQTNQGNFNNLLQQMQLGASTSGNP